MRRKGKKTTYDSVIVNSNSTEARNYDFSVGDTFFPEMLNLEKAILNVLNAN